MYLPQHPRYHLAVLHCIIGIMAMEQTQAQASHTPQEHIPIAHQERIK
jgi:hypothetical protein